METNGLITKISPKTFEDTYNSLKAIIEQNPNLGIVAELDHSANAARVDLTLNPTRILFFGNPKLGTMLMKENQAVGIDLPQKMLVTEQDGQVTISYNDPSYLKDRHQLSNGVSAILTKMSGALDAISSAAIS